MTRCHWHLLICWLVSWNDFGPMLRYPIQVLSRIINQLAGTLLGFLSRTGNLTC